MRRLPPMVCLLLLSACESGLLRGVEVSLPADVETRFSTSAPGVVVADLGGERAPYVVLCGQGLENPVFLSQDLGFGCLGERDGTQETIRVWVQPLPANAAGDTSCSTQRSFYERRNFTPPDGGSDGLADAADPGWPQGTTTGTWRRDLSPCGGSLSTKVALAVP